MQATNWKNRLWSLYFYKNPTLRPIRTQLLRQTVFKAMISFYEYAYTPLIEKVDNNGSKIYNLNLHLYYILQLTTL